MTRTALLLRLLFGALGRCATRPPASGRGSLPGALGGRANPGGAPGDGSGSPPRCARWKGLELAEPSAAEPPPDALAQAREAVKEAVALRQKRDFVSAEAALARAFTAYTTAAAALPNGHEVADAYALRAARALRPGPG